MVENLYGWLAVSSFFQKQTCRVLIQVGVTAGTHWTLAKLVDTGAGPDFFNTLFPPLSWQANVKPVKAPLRNATGQAVSIQGLISLHIRVRDLQARAWIGIVENLAVDLHLPDRVEGSANALQTSGNTHVSTEIRVTPRGE